MLNFRRPEKYGIDFRICILQYYCTNQSETPGWYFTTLFESTLFILQNSRH